MRRVICSDALQDDLFGCPSQPNAGGDLKQIEGIYDDVQKAMVEVTFPRRVLYRAAYRERHPTLGVIQEPCQPQRDGSHKNQAVNGSGDAWKIDEEQARLIVNRAKKKAYDLHRELYPKKTTYVQELDTFFVTGLADSAKQDAGGDLKR